MRTAYDNLLTSGIVLDDLKQEVGASVQAYQQSVQMEQSGLAIPLDVLAAQDALLNSRLQYENESFSRTVFQLDLIRANGDLDPSTPRTLFWVGPEAP